MWVTMNPGSSPARSAGEPARTRVIVGRFSITRTVTPGSAAPPGPPPESPGSSVSSSAPGPVIIMCD